LAVEDGSKTAAESPTGGGRQIPCPSLQKRFEAVSTGNGEAWRVKWRGARESPRRNQTHASSTDPESMLYRKAAGKEAGLCFGAQVLMEPQWTMRAD
jgi:hypothetical protein